MNFIRHGPAASFTRFLTAIYNWMMMAGSIEDRCGKSARHVLWKPGRVIASGDPVDVETEHWPSALNNRALP